MKLKRYNYIKAKGEPNLIIMDIDMPVFNGIETIEKLRERNYSKINVIFLTALASKELVMRCRCVGAKDYIVKPVSPVYLKERVEVALGEAADRE